jgi:arylsulfatase
VGLEAYTISSNKALSPGKHLLKFDFDYEGGRGGGGIGSIYLDEAKVGEGKIMHTNSNTFGIDESADVGTDENTPVTLAYAKKEKFNGKIKKVTIETK